MLAICPLLFMTVYTEIYSLYQPELMLSVLVICSVPKVMIVKCQGLH
jgi:hypothetical protein